MLQDKTHLTLSQYYKNKLHLLLMIDKYHLMTKSSIKLIKEKKLGHKH
jgi:hypothetical protein